MLLEFVGIVAEDKSRIALTLSKEAEVAHGGVKHKGTVALATGSVAERSVGDKRRFAGVATVEHSELVLLRVAHVF